ncbi:MAG: glycosyltransferase family 39 protein [Deltaproteobacteria bacterium]|nr:glycosyltransferase family 39 protein [Deltaproteobacteria bacterium]
MIRLLYKLSSRAYLTLAVLAATVPFLNLRMLRMAGDEKVYVSQAIEMARDGRWFAQTLAGEPSYFKGPLHYVLVRIGMMIFGDKLIAGLWMNALFAVVVALALYRLGREYLREDRAVLLALIGALNVGVFSHALASQMEVELCAFYALAAMTLGNKFEDEPGFKSDIWFWLAAGVAGWVKSPAHSVLIAAGAIVYWALNGTLLRRARSPGSWLAALAGIAVCVAGYLPALLSDYANFRETFVMRENVMKANNNRAWHYVVNPLLHFALPWTLVFFFGLARAWKAPASARPLQLLGLSLALPTIFFWASWTYKGQNYNLPAMSALFIFAVASFDRDIPKIAFQIVGALGLAALICAMVLVFHFLPLPDWWSWNWIFFSFASILIFASAFLFSVETRVLGLGAVFFLLGMGAFITPLGLREMRDARAFAGEHPDATLHYDDLDPSIWSEWGLLQLALHRPVFGVHKPLQLDEALKPGHAIFLPGDASLERVKKAFEERNSAATNATPGASSISPAAPPYRVEKWSRWLTKGKSAEGQPMWKLAWQERDPAKLERTFYIFWIPSER